MTPTWMSDLISVISSRFLRVRRCFNKKRQGQINGRIPKNDRQGTYSRRFRQIRDVRFVAHRQRGFEVVVVVNLPTSAAFVPPIGKLHTFFSLFTFAPCFLLAFDRIDNSGLIAPLSLI